VVITALYDDAGTRRGFAKVTRDDSAARAAREREAALGEITAALLAGRSGEEVLALRTGEPAVVTDFPTQSSAGSWLQGHGAGLVVPMVAGDTPVGVLIASMPAGGLVLGDSDLDMLRSFAREAAVVLAYQRLQEELRQQQILEDRARIARDLHDHVIQLRPPA